MDFLITGTHAYGPVRPQSDLDVVMRYGDSENLKDFLMNHDIPLYRSAEQLKHHYDGFYFDLGEIQVNIVVAADTSDFALWKKRTEEMKLLDPIDSRGERIKRFNEIV